MKFVEAKIDGIWVIVDEINVTENNTFTIYDEDVNESIFKMSEYEMRIVCYEKVIDGTCENPELLEDEE